MVNIFSAVILLFLLMPVHLTFAQENPKGVKIYSGYIHHYGAKSKDSLWHMLFGVKSPKVGEFIQDMQCSVEFDSPISFFSQAVSSLPDQLSYYIRFKNDPRTPHDISVQGKDPFEKFVIKIYTNDDEEYSIDPFAEGSQVGIGDEHHIHDTYLVYLILGHNINHLEIVGASGNEEYKYILDKLEVHDNP